MPPDLAVEEHLDREPGEGSYLSRALLGPYVEVLRGLAIEAGMAGVYYPAADAILLPHEREALERACPEP